MEYVMIFFLRILHSIQLTLSKLSPRIVYMIIFKSWLTTVNFLMNYGTIYI